MESTNLIKFLCASAEELLRRQGADAAADRNSLEEAAELLNLAAKVMERNAPASIDRRAA